MLSIAQDLLEFYPRDDCSYLNRIVVRAGVFIATNAHVAILGSCDLHDGHYNKDLKPLPPIENYPSEKVFEYFSKISTLNGIRAAVSGQCKGSLFVIAGVVNR